MNCPECKSQSILKHGVLKKGQERYICLDCQRTFQTRNIKRIWFGGLILLGLIPALLYGLLQVMMGNPNDRDRVESIVVLGRGPEHLRERTLAAAKLWQENRASHVFASGMGDAPQMIQLLQQMGIPETQITGERCSQNTWENGLFSDILLSKLKTRRILLVTDKAHMARAASVFRGFGFEVVPAPLEEEFSPKQVQVHFRELAGLIAYGVSGKLSRDKSAQAAQHKVEAHHKIKSWKCSLGSVSKK